MYNDCSVVEQNGRYPSRIFFERSLFSSHQHWGLTINAKVDLKTAYITYSQKEGQGLVEHHASSWRYVLSLRTVCLPCRDQVEEHSRMNNLSGCHAGIKSKRLQTHVITSVRSSVLEFIPVITQRGMLKAVPEGINNGRAQFVPCC